MIDKSLYDYLKILVFKKDAKFPFCPWFTQNTQNSYFSAQVILEKMNFDIENDVPNNPKYPNKLVYYISNENTSLLVKVTS